MLICTAKELIKDRMTKAKKEELEIRVRIGTRLREIRVKKGYTMAQTGAELGMDESYISRIETGKHNFGIDILVKYCKLFEANLDIY